MYPHRLISFCLLLIGLVPVAWCSVKTDSLYLNNGNVITGEIKKLDFGVLTFKTDDIGTLTINWTDVRKLRSAANLEITFSNNKILEGSIDTAGLARELQVITDTGSMTVNMDNIVKIVLIKNSFKSRIDGSINFGLSYTKGSQILNYNLSGNISYRSLHDLVQLSGNSAISRDRRVADSVEVVRKQDFKLSYSRYFNNRWYVQSYFGVDQNTELGLKSRIFLGLAGGKELFQNKLHGLNTGIGVLGNREKPISGDIRYNVESGFLIDYRIYKRTYPKVTLTTSMYTIPSLTDLGRIRINSETDLSFEIVKDFTIGFSTYQSFDNRPATVGASKYDWGISTTIGYSF